MAMGGVGEAMLLGAAMGGGSAALMGGDPLKGALMGGLTGGAGAGISGLLPGAAAATPGVIAPAVTPVIAPTAATLAPELAASTAANAVATSAPVSQSLISSPALANFPGSANVSGPYVSQVAGQAAAIPANAGPALTQIPAGQTFAQASQAAMNPASGTLGSGTFGVMPPATGGISNIPITPVTPAAPKTFLEGMGKFAGDPIASIMKNKPTAFASALAGASAKKKKEEEEEYSGPLSRFKYNPDSYRPSGYADGGITSLSGYDQMVGEQPMYQAMARGGIADLGSYSDGGRMLKGPGDGMSDSIPASISGKRPARLADGEFVIPADVVSHLGNGSTDAGAKQLYAMMNKVRQARTGRKAQGREINPRQYVPA
jgi:hypothetical protein